MTHTPETNKIPGVCYAFNPEDARELPGVELPIIDLTHPAFAFSITSEQLDALINSLIESTQRLAKMPPDVLRGILQQSLLMRGMLVDSANTYTSGLMTYVNKLSPAALGAAYAGPLDRQWAASLTPTTFRWRMHDVARLLADGLALALAEQPAARPLELFNIAGGPAADSLNALIFLRKERPELLADRPIHLHVYDLEVDGPRFGEQALAALRAEGAPLHGLAVEYSYSAYDWNDPAGLAALFARVAERGALAAGTSEGGLFEYAADAVIAANLSALCAGLPADALLVGPVVRDSASLDPRLRATEHVPGRPAVRYLGLERLREIARGAGWRMAAQADGVMHQVVRLTKG